ncbi:MAG: damage-inducible protein DinB [Bauldia sp.]|nr:damage-inducible protein DinB [Bauldia sp.]
MPQNHRMFAAYNRWANRSVYAAVADLDDADWRAERGAFFGSIRGTLNHLLVADRIWMRRFTGEGETAPTLDTILFDAFAPLATARRAEDERIVAFVAGLDDARLDADIRYSPLAAPGVTHVQPLGEAVAHFFNHQTHHRGQVHTMLTMARGREASLVLDLVAFQRTDEYRAMRAG